MNVDCPREDCRIQSMGSTRTLMGWTPTYDKQGNCLTSDPNKTTTHFKCLVCHKNWSERV